LVLLLIIIDKTMEAEFWKALHHGAFSDMITYHHLKVKHYMSERGLTHAIFMGL